MRAEQIPLPEQAPAQALLADPYAADGFERLRAYYAYGFRGGNPLVLRTILGREPIDFTTELQDHLPAAAARKDASCL